MGHSCTYRYAQNLNTFRAVSFRLDNQPDIKADTVWYICRLFNLVSQKNLIISGLIHSFNYVAQYVREFHDLTSNHVLTKS